MGGTIWATFGRSPLRDKVFHWGAHFGLHLVEVCCMTKSADEGHNLDHIWSKSAVRQSPMTRGIISFATFGHCPLRDNFVQWPIMGIILWPHLTKVRCVTRPQTNDMCFPFYARFGQCQLIDVHLSLVIFQFFECLEHEHHSQHYLHGLLSQEARFHGSSQPSFSFQQLLGACDWMHQTQYHLRYRDHQPRISMHPIPLGPPDPFQFGWQTHCLHWKLVKQNGVV